MQLLRKSLTGHIRIAYAGGDELSASTCIGIFMDIILALLH